MRSISEIMRRVRKNDLKLFRFEWIGNDLIIRAMEATREALKDHLSSGIGITKAMQCFNALDHLVSDGIYGSEADEFRIFPDLNTFALLPYASGNARFICELYDPDLKPSPTDARFFLRRVVKEAEAMRYKPMAACELEFQVFKAGEAKPTPFIHEKFGMNHGYDLANVIITEWVDCLAQMGVTVERIKKEYAPSQYEPSLKYADPLKAADDAVTLRDVAKGICANHGLVASFMPKIYQWHAGNGMHLHMSLFDQKSGKNLFFDKTDRRGFSFSRLGYHFIGGVMRHMKGLSVFGAPLSNSYKRLLPGSWAPAHLCYGYDHRGAAVRIPPTYTGSSPNASRIEFRLPDPAASPYLALGTLLAAGLDGIKNKTDPGQPVTIDPAKLAEKELAKQGIEYLPRTLGEAIDCARKDTFLRKTLGEPLHEEYLKARISEWKEYREQVTEWEVTNYLTSF